MANKGRDILHFIKAYKNESGTPRSEMPPVIPTLNEDLLEPLEQIRNSGALQEAPSSNEEEEASGLIYDPRSTIEDQDVIIVTRLRLRPGSVHVGDRRIWNVYLASWIKEHEQSLSYTLLTPPRGNTAEYFGLAKTFRSSALGNPSKEYNGWVHDPKEARSLGRLVLQALEWNGS